MIKLTLISLLCASSLANRDITEDVVEELGVINVEIAKIEDYPFVAQLESCGGVIISDVWVLTAAHCEMFFQHVWVGSDQRKGGTKMDVAEKYIHPKWRSSYRDPAASNLSPLVKDLALLKLEKPLSFSKKVQSVKLYRDDVKPGTEGVILGFGEKSLHAHDPSEELRKASVVLKTKEACEKAVGYRLCKLCHYCVQQMQQNQASCYGDSGSPLIMHGQVAGLMSYPLPTAPCKPGHPAIYAKFHFDLDWIKNVTGISV